MLFLLLGLAAASCVRAADPPPALPAPAATAAAPDELALTPEILSRWGYDVDKVLALPPEKRAELRTQLSRLEMGRARRLELLRRIKPDDWRTYVDDRQLLTPEGSRLVDEYLARMKDEPLLVPARVTDFARSDGAPLTGEDLARARQILDRMFEGVAAKGGKNMSGDVVVDAHVRGDTVYDMTVSSPKTGLALSAGQLFVDNQYPLAETSPYANLTWGKDSRPDSAVDYRFKASLGYVDLRSRYFSDDSNSGVNSALQLGSQLGVPQNRLSQIAQYATYDDPYETHGIIVSSLLAQLARAYHVAGPVDASWAVGGLVKTMWVAPNAAFDETLGLRVRLKDGLSLGFFGGVAQNLSPVGDNLVQQALASNTVGTGLYLENDPHVSVALWGRVPGASDLTFSASASQRWTSETKVREGELSLMTTFLKHPLALKGVVSRENGAGIGYDRTKERAEIDYGVADNAQAYVAYQRDHVVYGNAAVDSNSVLAGFTMQFGGKGSLTVDKLMGGQYADHSPQQNELFQKQLSQIQGDLTAAVNAMEQVNQAYQNLQPGLNPTQLESDLNQLSSALSHVGPAQAAALLSQLGLTPAQQAELGNIWLKTVSPSSPYYSQLVGLLGPGQKAASQAGQTLGQINNWSNYFAQHQGEIRQLIALLGDAQVWDSAVVAAARAQLIAAMTQYGKINVPILGGDFTLRLDAPAVLAASNILQSRLSPVAPVQASQVDAWLMREAGAELGLSGTPNAQQVAGALFGLADQQLKQQLAQSLAPLSGQIANLGTPQALSAQILSSVPPNVAALLKQNFGPNLTGLIPSDLSGAALKNYLNQLPGQITTFLENRYGTQLATGIAQGVSWAGELLSREANMTMIQLMLASEELDRLTVDHGAKIDELDLRMAMRSFDQLDARGKQESRARLSAVETLVARQTGVDDARLALKFQTHGRTVLQTLQLSPSWPAGLRVQVDDDAWVPLMTLYGDGRFFELVERMRRRYLAAPHPQGLTVEFGYRTNDASGTWITPRKDPPRVKIELTRPNSESEAAFRLSSLADYVDEKK